MECKPYALLAVFGGTKYGAISENFEKIMRKALCKASVPRTPSCMILHQQLLVLKLPVARTLYKYGLFYRSYRRLVRKAVYKRSLSLKKNASTPNVNLRLNLVRERATFSGWKREQG
jgi:hypothetical protein